MPRSEDSPMAFAPEHDVPIPYMQRTRDYYLKLGYGAYRWAHFYEVPFTPLLERLAQSRLALITTAAPYPSGLGEQGAVAPYEAAAQVRNVHFEGSETVPD